MKYYWTNIYNNGVFTFWKVETEAELLKLAKKHYGITPFGHGETCQKSYDAAAVRGN